MKIVLPNTVCLRFQKLMFWGGVFFNPGHNICLAKWALSLLNNIQSAGSNRTETVLSLKEQSGTFYYQERKEKRKNILCTKIKLWKIDLLNSAVAQEPMDLNSSSSVDFARFLCLSPVPHQFLHSGVLLLFQGPDRNRWWVGEGWGSLRSTPSAVGAVVATAARGSGIPAGFGG